MQTDTDLDRYLLRCPDCGQPIFVMLHHYTGTEGRFDPVPWSPPPEPDYVALKKQEAERARRDRTNFLKAAPFRFSLALLDFDRGLYELVQPMASVRKPKPGAYFIPHQVHCGAFDVS